MNEEHCKAALGRIVAYYRLNAADRAAYEVATLEALGWMNGYEFDEVTKAMLPELGAYLPKPGAYRAMHEKLAAKNGWRNKPRAICQTCGGTRFVLGYYRPPVGIVMEAADPCPTCSPLRDLPRDPRLERIDRSVYDREVEEMQALGRQAYGACRERFARASAPPAEPKPVEPSPDPLGEDPPLSELPY